ncbi:MAG: hypothetical protein HND52_02715 [Ignavibacteriae bacterium]|nr:hypothetical protein [Ignavibacteriota bacterium]NOG96863.1 hypothetical protein [Ignavibacteriota bacterium]
MLVAQENKFDFEHISLESGLSQGTINTIFQDSKGFMWFGTEEGLNRYDGYEMKVFKNIPGDSTSLSANYVWSICEDSLGYIWVGIYGGGLSRYDPEYNSFKNYFHNENDSTSLSNNVVERVHVDKNNNLWVGTYGGGLNKFDYSTDNFSKIILQKLGENNLAKEKIFSLCEDADGNIWIGTDGAGLIKLNRHGKVIKHYFNDPQNKFSLNNDIIPTMLCDDNGILWVGTYGNGLNKFDPRKEKFYNTNNSVHPFDNLSGKIILSLLRDSQGKIWIATLANGVYLYDTISEALHHIAADPVNSKSLSTNNIRSIYEDKSNNIWIGTLVEGINKTDIKPKMFFHLKNNPNNENSLNNNFVFSITEDNRSNIWIGTYGGGLNRLNLKTGKYSFYRENNNIKGAISSNTIRSLLVDHNDDLWVGTYYGGLCKYNRKRDSFTIYKEGKGKYDLPLNDVRAIFEDSENKLWIGTNGGGLSYFNREENKFINYMFDPTDEKGISHNSILSICEDSAGFIWIGTYGGGLNKFDKTTQIFTHFKNLSNDKNSISSDLVTELYLSKKGELWAGTWGGGLNKFIPESNSFISFSEAEGFASAIICGILEDDNGMLWISTLKGITKFDPNNYSIKNYNFNDGLQKGEFNPDAHFKSADGTMYFGGTLGINYFHPKNILESDFEPQVVFTSFKVYNSDVELEKDIEFTEIISLSYKDNNFSFEYSSLDFTSPAKNKYAYMLQGLDKNWIEAGSRRFANYTHLDPGEYVFKVKATNHSGVWSSNTASINIMISPPFWSTWLFRILFTLLLISIGFYFYRKRIMNLEREKKAQEVFSERLINSQEAERERIASELHDSFGQNLLIIKNRALLGLKTNDNENSKQQFNEISSSASSALDEVRQISYNLHPYQLKRLGLTKAIKSIITNVDEIHNVSFEIEDTNIDDLFSKDNEINVYRVVQECVNNIIKHSEASEASVSISRFNETVTMSISDNGKGFNTDEAKNKNGFGIQNIERRLQLLKGKVEVKSELGKGTKVKIIIPVNKNE